MTPTNKIKGACIEFYRLSEDATTTLKKVNFLKFIKHYPQINGSFFQYKKIIKGEFLEEDIYDHYLKVFQIPYEEIIVVDQEIKDIDQCLVSAISDFKEKEIEEIVNRRYQFTKQYKTKYPYRLQHFISLSLKQFYLDKKMIVEMEEYILIFLINSMSEDTKLVLIHLLFTNKVKKTRNEEKIKTIFQQLFPYFSNHTICFFICTFEAMFENDMELALKYTKLIEDECIKRNNIKGLINAYQFYEEIYETLNKQEKKKESIEKLYKLLEEHDHELSQVFKNRIYYHIGMNYFVSKEYFKAKPLLENSLKTDFNLLFFPAGLYYQFICDQLKMKNELFDLKEINFKKYNKTYEIQWMYYILKHDKNKKLNLLEDYILEKVLPILGKFSRIENNIFLEELSNLCEKTKHQYKVDFMKTQLKNLKAG